MMGVALARLLFAVVAASVVLSTMGLAAPPHRVAPGTPKNHSLVLGAYRFAFLLDQAEESAPLSPAMAALHKALALAGVPITNMPGMDEEEATNVPTIATAGLSALQDLAITLALLAALAPRLARPTRRIIAGFSVGCAPEAQWRPPSPLAPPRLVVLSFTAR